MQYKIDDFLGLALNSGGGGLESQFMTSGFFCTQSQRKLVQDSFLGGNNWSRAWQIGEGNWSGPLGKEMV
jgi:hypothetical protein